METKKIIVHGREWEVPSLNNDGQFNFMSHEIFNLQVYDYHVCKIESQDVVIDVGANIGMFTTYCFEHEVSSVIAIEPGETFPCLVKNTAHYSDNIIYRNHAAWDYDTSLDFVERLDESGQSHVKGQINSDNYSVIKRVPAQCIDTVIKNSNIECVDFIKIDTEGSELEALRGAYHTIKRFKPKLAVCLYHKQDDWETIPRFISSIVHSYKFVPVSYRETRADIGYFF